MLPVKVSASFLEKIFDAIKKNTASKFTVDLPNQKISIDASNASESFEINPYKKDNMINGFDDIDYLLNIKNDIESFSKDTPL